MFQRERWTGSTRKGSSELRLGWHYKVKLEDELLRTVTGWRGVVQTTVGQSRF
jgi:hypothetical protein